jgi:nucleoside-diphosphate-sugar epimerase
VENVADAVVLALQCKPAIGKAFTIVDDNVKQADYVELYRSVAHENWRPVYLPVGAVALAARMAERALGLLRRRSPVTYHQVRRSTDGATFDCSRAREILGWQPKVSVHDGLRACFGAPSDPPPGTPLSAVA